MNQYDPRPILRVSERIIRGLYFKHIGKPLGSGIKCYIWLSDMFTAENKDHLLSTINNMKKSGSLHFVGENDEFAYLYSRTEYDFATAWMLTFNRETYIFGITDKAPNHGIHDVPEKAAKFD